MAVSNLAIFPQTIKSVVTQFTHSTSTSTPTQLIAAQTNGMIVEAILVASTDSAAHDINLYLNISSTNYLIGTISIPANAGNSDTIPAVNLLSALSAGLSLLPLPKDAMGNPYLYLDASTALYAAPAATITTSDVWNITVMGGAY